MPSENIKGGLVVADRPQISVELEGGFIKITVAGIADDFQTVAISEVEFPAECAPEVARALVNLAGN